MIVHVPHSSPKIPKCSILNKSLSLEHLTKHTDLYTDILFKPDNDEITELVYKKSRFYCDVERLLNDPLDAKGNGLFYEKVPGTDIKIRDKITDHVEYTLVMKEYYDWHFNLQQASEKYFKTYGKCIIIDAHSFSWDQTEYLDNELPDICIGVNIDTTSDLIDNAVKVFEKSGYSVAIDFPFSNAQQTLSLIHI